MLAGGESIDKCRAYFASAFAMTPAQRAEANRRLRRTAVTLSRQCGSRATTIARRLVDLLNRRDAGTRCGWMAFDDNLVRRVLEDHDLPKRIERFMPEDVPNLIDDALCGILGVHPGDWTLFQHTADTIYRLAALGRVVIVGRGGNIITRGLPSVLHVRLVGSPERRAAHIGGVLAIPAQEARAHVARTDRARRRYVMAHFDRDIDDSVEYDLVLNTDRFSDEEAAGIIADLVVPGEAAESGIP
jgi:hypothetical protein